MTSKCNKERVVGREDKESNRDVQQDCPQDDKVVEVRTDQPNYPVKGISIQYAVT